MDVFTVHGRKARNSVSPGDERLVNYPRLPPILPVDDVTDSKLTMIIVMCGSRNIFRREGVRSEGYLSLSYGVRGISLVILL